MRKVAMKNQANSGTPAHLPKSTTKREPPHKNPQSTGNGLLVVALGPQKAEGELNPPPGASLLVQKGNVLPVPLSQSGEISVSDAVLFAAIVADNGTPKDLIDSAKPCIGVLATGEDHLLLTDGLVATKDGFCSIACPGESLIWPELHRALSLRVRGYLGVTNRTQNEPGYLRLKNYVEDGFTAYPPVPNTEAHGIRALVLLANWNRWVADKAIDYTIASETLEWLGQKNDIQTTEREQEVLRRKTFLELELKRGVRLDFDQPWQRLLKAVRLALLVHRRAWPNE